MSQKRYFHLRLSNSIAIESLSPDISTDQCQLDLHRYDIQMQYASNIDYAKKMTTACDSKICAYDFTSIFGLRPCFAYIGNAYYVNPHQRHEELPLQKKKHLNETNNDWDLNLIVSHKRHPGKTTTYLVDHPIPSAIMGRQFFVGGNFKMCILLPNHQCLLIDGVNCAGTGLSTASKTLSRTSMMQN